MPSDDPNSKMDDLLRAYAKKRRGQSEGPGEIHPATRRLLQGEVRRTFGAGKDEGNASRLTWRKWRIPLIAMWGGAAALLVVFAVFNAQLDRLAPAKSPPQNQNAMTKPPVSKKDMPLLTKRSDASDKRLGVPDQPAKSASIAANRSVSARPRPAPGGAPAGRPVATPSLASDSAAVPNGSVAAMDLPATIPAEPVPPGKPPPGAAASPLAASAPAAPAPTEGRSSMEFEMAKVPSAVGGSIFDSNAQDFVRATNESRPEPAPSVLSNFRLSRAGRNVSIVDHDGSIYNGTVAEEAPAVESATRRSQYASARQSAKATNDNWNFNVSGTNRSLQQNVTFNGAVQSQSAGFNNNALGRGRTLSRGSRATIVSGTVPATNAASISGTVQIGQGRQFKIEATPPARSP